MDNFSSELKVDRIRTIKLGSEYFTYFKEKDHSIFIVGRSSIKFKLEVIEEIIQKIYMKFWRQYEPFLENFEGDSSKFETFSQEIKNLD